MASLFPSRASSFATRGRLDRIIRRSHASRSSPSSQSSPSMSRVTATGRQRATTTVAYGLLASATTATTTALCDDGHSKGDDNDDDDDFIAKIKSKIEALDLAERARSFDLADDPTLNAAAIAIGSRISAALSSGVPADLSYGFLAGYLSGLALKKAGRIASVALGMGFLGLQTLAYHGYVEVRHDEVRRRVEGLLDRNGDGVVDGEDLRAALEDLRRVAGFGLEGEEDGANANAKMAASGGGFGMGFWGGLRSG